MLSATDAKTKWDAICVNCTVEVGQSPDPASKMSACLLQLGIPLFKGYSSTADRDALQAAFLASPCQFAVGNGGVEKVPAETIQMARQIADSQAPPVGAPAPPSVPTPTKAAVGDVPIVPILAIVAGGGLLWWLLKSKKKGS
jgi:hypothetical protein